MTSSIVNTFIYENLKQIAKFNSHTKLCIYEPTHKLYIVKDADISCKQAYEAIMSLNNLHIAKINYIAQKQDHIEIVREYVSGDTLADLIKGEKALPSRLAVKIVSDICDGLSDIHKLGYVHRDINPNNIIITSEGSAKIIDFGIARSFSQNKSSDTTILGTPGYAAPEQFGFSQSDARTDIYAVGVLLNVLLTGKLPNESKVNGSIGKVIAKCISIDSKHRYKNISELKKAINNKVSDGSHMDDVIRQIPGLRSQHIPVIIFAIICYVLVILLSVGIFTTAKKGEYVKAFISWALLIPIPFISFSNFLNIWDTLPFSRGAAKHNQRIVYTVIGIMSILFGLTIL